MARRKVLSSLLIGALAYMTGCRARSETPAAPGLTLERATPLAGVAGRIDHLAYDAKQGRVFVAELGNSSVEGVDLATGRSVERIGGLNEPQGLALLPQRDELAVASGSRAIA